MATSGGTMSEADLVADLRASLGDAGSAFKANGDDDYQRMLRASLPDLATKRPRTKLGRITLTEGVDVYPLEGYPDFIDLKSHLWGDDRRPVKPWEPGYPGAIPRVAVQVDNAAYSLAFELAPTAAQISALGSTFRFWYMAPHVIGVDAGDTTVAPADRSLLLLRAQAEAMRELAMRHVSKPVQMNDGYSGVARNSTPPALFELLLQLFKEAR